MSVTETSKIEELANKEYKYGFVTDIETESLPKGLNDEIIGKLSAIKKEPPYYGRTSLVECEILTNKLPRLKLLLSS